MSQDYYAVLGVPPTATTIQIKTAYKKAALRWHPDRVPADSPERAERTKRFQQINDAYYTLSDEGRRHDYDAARQWQSGDTESEFDAADTDADGEVPPRRPRAGGFPWSAFGFGSPNSAGAGTGAGTRADTQWRSAFEEMMSEADWSDGSDGATNAQPPEAARGGKFWSIVGSVSGATLGFIVANWPGAVAGGAAGNRLGAVRDKHGKSVFEVYQTLPQADKARLLAELATRLFSQTLAS